MMFANLDMDEKSHFCLTAGGPMQTSFHNHTRLESGGGDQEKILERYGGVDGWQNKLLGKKLL